MLTWLRTIGATFACVLSLAAPVLAQTSSETGYDETAVLSQTGGAPTTEASSTVSAGTSSSAGTAPELFAERLRGAGSESDAAEGEPVNVAATSPRLSSGGRASLPFTGLDVIVVALAGLLLLGIGTAMRHGAASR